MEKRMDRAGGIILLVVSCALADGSSNPLPDPLEAGWQGDRVCERLHEDEDQRILRCTFPPGVGHERHFHVKHVGYNLTGGRLQMTDAAGTRVIDIAAGDTFVSDGVDWHEAVNIGDTTLVYLVIEPKPVHPEDALPDQD
jgi:quercetin dioxygenase-like cupin family protein